MAVTEKQRHELFTEFESLLGSKHAESLMELLPPVGWADVATKRDLDSTAAATRSEIKAVGQELRSEMGALGQELRSEMAVVRERMATKDDLHVLRRDMITWLLLAMGIQTAVVGLLFGLIGR